jgi:putative DNA primase/helicase
MNNPIDFEALKSAVNQCEWPIRYGSEGYNKTQSYLIKGLLPESSSICVYGPSGSYKSFVVLSWCCHIATGLEWDGRKVKPSSVLYIAGEGGIGVSRRINAWEKSFNHCKPVDNLARIDGPVFPADQTQARALVEACYRIETETGQPVRLIVFDTLARCFGGSDENSARDMGAFIAGCDWIKQQTNAAILVVHHSGKDADKGARGSSALRAALDVEFKVVKEESETATTLTNTKMKDAEPSQTLSYDLDSIHVLTDEDGDLISSLAVIPQGRPPDEEKPKGKNLNKNQMLIWQAVRSRTAKAESTERKVILDDLKALGANTKNFARSINQLVDYGLLEVKGSILTVAAQSEANNEE